MSRLGEVIAVLSRQGLYYPYIHFRSDTWLKTAALYWSAMARVVPPGYLATDSYAAGALADAGFVNDLSPGEAGRRTEAMFVRLLEEHGPELQSKLGWYDENESDRWSDVFEGSVALGFIYAETMCAELRDRLFDLRLALPAADVYKDFRPRLSIRRLPKNWIGVREEFASLYMCALIDDIAATNSLVPVTDQAGALDALAGWEPEMMLDLLLGDGLPNDRAGVRDPAELRTLVAQLALEIAMPVDIGREHVQHIVRFRNRHRTEMDAFQAAVDAAVADLEILSPDINEEILQQYIADTVRRHFDEPRKELERALTFLNAETVVSTLSVQTALPAAATLGSLGATVNPVIGAVAGVAVGVASVAAQAWPKRRQAKGGAGAANYLLSVERAFGTPSTALQRSLSLFRGR